MASSSSALSTFSSESVVRREKVLCRQRLASLGRPAPAPASPGAQTHTAARAQTHAWARAQTQTWAQRQTLAGARDQTQAPPAPAGEPGHLTTPLKINSKGQFGPVSLELLCQTRATFGPQDAAPTTLFLWIRKACRSRREPAYEEFRISSVAIHHTDPSWTSKKASLMMMNPSYAWEPVVHVHENCGAHACGYGNDSISIGSVSCGYNISHVGSAIQTEKDGSLHILWEIEVEFVSAKNSFTRQSADDVVAIGPEGALALWRKALPAARNAPELHDFSLYCGGKKFPCSKFVLGASSEVFKAMFSHKDLAEAKKHGVTIDDSTPEAVGHFLDLLYAGEAKMSADTAGLVYALGHKYQVEEVTTAVCRHLRATMNLLNVTDIAVMAHVYSEAELLDDALKMMRENTEVVKVTPGWKLIESRYPEILTKLVLSMQP